MPATTIVVFRETSPNVLEATERHTETLARRVGPEAATAALRAAFNSLSADHNLAEVVVNVDTDGEHRLRAKVQELHQ